MEHEVLTGKAFEKAMAFRAKERRLAGARRYRMQEWTKKRVEVLEKLRDASLKEGEGETDPVSRAYYVGISTGIQLALHGDLRKLLGE